jgi:positive regulator of sigma E activity
MNESTDGKRPVWRADYTLRMHLLVFLVGCIVFDEIGSDIGWWIYLIVNGAIGGYLFYFLIKRRIK